jgi:hypothetical protein
MLAGSMPAFLFHGSTFTPFAIPADWVPVPSQKSQLNKFTMIFFEVFAIILDCGIPASFEYLTNVGYDNHCQFHFAEYKCKTGKQDLAEIPYFETEVSENEKSPNFLKLLCGADGTRTRDPRRDRPIF